MLVEDPTSNGTRLFFFGGWECRRFACCGRGGCFSFDTASSRWSRVATSLHANDGTRSPGRQEPSPRKGHQALLMPDQPKMLMIGGMCEDSDNFYSYDFSTKVWRQNDSFERAMSSKSVPQLSFDGLFVLRHKNCSSKLYHLPETRHWYWCAYSIEHDSWEAMDLDFDPLVAGTCARDGILVNDQRDFVVLIDWAKSVDQTAVQRPPLNLIGLIYSFESDKWTRLFGETASISRRGARLHSLGDQRSSCGLLVFAEGGTHLIDFGNEDDSAASDYRSENQREKDNEYLHNSRELAAKFGHEPFSVPAQRRAVLVQSLSCDDPPKEHEGTLYGNLLKEREVAPVSVLVGTDALFSYFGKVTISGRVQSQLRKASLPDVNRSLRYLVYQFCKKHF